MNPGGPYSWVIPINPNGTGIGYLPLTGGEITGTVGIGVAQQTNWALTITEPPGYTGPSWAGGIVINNTDVVGGSLPMVINDHPGSLSWNEITGGTEGPMLRLYDGTQIYDFGISQIHNFYLGNGHVITGQLITARLAETLVFRMGHLLLLEISRPGAISSQQMRSEVFPQRVEFSQKVLRVRMSLA
jgi:hypothetical protein